jgi:hypothetical protein
MYVRAFVCMYVCVCTYVCRYVYTPPHTQTHTGRDAEDDRQRRDTHLLFTQEIIIYTGNYYLQVGMPKTIDNDVIPIWLSLGAWHKFSKSNLYSDFV